MKRGKNTGRCKTRIYTVWRGMKERCTNSNHKNYILYKDKLCDEWYSSVKSIEWAYNNGYEEGLTIDRIDSNKGYFPDNCRFITAKENTIKGNKERRLKEFEYKGKFYTCRELCDISGLNMSTMRQRLETMSVEDALTKPYRYTKRTLDKKHGCDILK